MKIVEVIPSLGSGGAERFVVDFCNELVRKEHEVTLIVFYPIDELGLFYQELDPRVSVKSLDKKKGIDFTLMFRLNRLLGKLQPDVVHSHVRAIIYIPLAVLCHRKFNFFHTVHSEADKEAAGKIGAVIRKILFKRKNVCPVTISKESERSFNEFYGYRAPIVFNGRLKCNESSIQVSVKKFFDKIRLSEETRVLVNVARFLPVKRQPLIAKVIDRLIKEGHDIQLLFIGRLEDAEMVNAVKSIGSDRIHLLGELNNPVDYLKLADGFCLLSEYEGMPISLIEALSVGCVPICTPVGGIVDVVNDGVNGFLSKNVSEEACYRALRRFLETTATEIGKMKQAAKESYEDFSMDKCSDKYLSLFNQQINVD